MYIHLVAKQPVKRAKSTYGGGYSHKCDSLSVIIEPFYTYKKYKKGSLLHKKYKRWVGFIKR